MAHRLLTILLVVACVLVTGCSYVNVTNNPKYSTRWTVGDVYVFKQSAFIRSRGIDQIGPRYSLWLPANPDAPKPTDLPISVEEYEQASARDRRKQWPDVAGILPAGTRVRFLGVWDIRPTVAGYGDRIAEVLDGRFKGKKMDLCLYFDENWLVPDAEDKKGSRCNASKLIPSGTKREEELHRTRTSIERIAAIPLTVRVAFSFSNTPSDNGFEAVDGLGDYAAVEKAIDEVNAEAKRYLNEPMELERLGRKLWCFTGNAEPIIGVPSEDLKESWEKIVQQYRDGIRAAWAADLPFQEYIIRNLQNMPEAPDTKSSRPFHVQFVLRWWIRFTVSDQPRHAGGALSRTALHTNLRLSEKSQAEMRARISKWFAAHQDSLRWDVHRREFVPHDKEISHFKWIFVDWVPECLQDVKGQDEEDGAREN